MSPLREAAVTVSADWKDPVYVAAKRANAAAYAVFCTVAAANPYRHGQDEHQEYYEQVVLPVKSAWMTARAAYNAETARVLQEGGLGL